MPAFACIVVVFGLIKKVPVFDVFISGAKEGVKLLYNIAPTIMGLVFAVDLLQSSGAIDAICALIQPTAEFLGFPKEIVPLVLLRPVSGSGSTALLTALYKTCGPDSFAGSSASVLAGSSETTFYAIAMYFGCIRVKKIRHTLFAANTVSNYVDALIESFIFYPAERFDIVGKQLLKANKKYYMVDLGIRNHILPRKYYDLGFSVENIVFFELLRRGCKVTIGKYQENEVDFVAEKRGEFTYIQVTADMVSESTFDREMKPLYAIQDNYEKIVLTLDKLTVGNYDGIKVVNVIDWLLNK